MKIKRIIAYIIDFLIVSIAASAIFTLPIFAKESQNYTKHYEEYINVIMSGGSADIDENKSIEIVYNMNKSSQSFNIIMAGLLIIYFGVISFIWKGKTIGKNIMHIKIEPISGKELKPNLFMLRQILVTNLIPLVLGIISTMFLSGSKWYTAYTAISNINYISYFLMLGFMIFRDDERGLHDVICKTKVISTEEK